MSDLPPAGWYADPEHAGQQRYWDGQQWTEHRAPMADAGQPPWSSSQPAYGGQPAYAGGYTGQNPAAHVDTWLWQSIVATILCCQPPGIVGIVFAAQANSAKNMGDVATARAKARLARIWTLVAVGVVVVGIVLVLVFAMIGAIADSSQF